MFCLCISSYFSRAGVGKCVLSKGQREIIFGFVDHTTLAENTQLCCCSVKAATDGMGTDGRGSVPIKLYS